MGVLNKWLLREVPNSRSCDEFSVEELQRLQIVLFTLRDPELNAVYNGTADVRHVPRELEVMAREWESLNAEAARSGAGPYASRRTLSRGSYVVRSPPPGVDEGSYQGQSVPAPALADSSRSLVGETTCRACTASLRGEGHLRKLSLCRVPNHSF